MAIDADAAKAKMLGTIGATTATAAGLAFTAWAGLKATQITADTKRHEIDEKTRVALRQMYYDLKMAKEDTDTQKAIAFAQLDAQKEMHKDEMKLEGDKLGLEREKLALERDKHKDDVKLAKRELDLKEKVDLGTLSLDWRKEKDQHEEEMAKIKSGYGDGWFGYV